MIYYNQEVAEETPDIPTEVAPEEEEEMEISEDTED